MSLRDPQPSDITDSLQSATPGAYVPLAPHTAPCPNCGHCPHCGRSNFGPYRTPYPQTTWYVHPFTYSGNIC